MRSLAVSSQIITRDLGLGDFDYTDCHTLILSSYHIRAKRISEPTNFQLQGHPA